MTAHSISGLEAWLQADIPARQRALEQLRDRIVTSDTSIQAWVDVQPQPATGDGALASIPFGAKDIIETANLPTEYGSPIYKGRRGTADAAIIRQLRSAGAILMGKTHTAAFAYFTPAVTRNPRNLDHTPGGSSSGSAAAVAAGMIPLALGTQTLGSVLRPASFCGITGFKPTYGLFSMEGVLPMARSLDTLGFFTDTPRDMLAVWRTLGQPGESDVSTTFGVPDPLPDVDPVMARAFQTALGALRVERVPIAPMLDRLAKEARAVMFYEGARFHEARYRQYGDRLQDLAALVREGLAMSDSRYQEALGFIAESKEQIAACFQSTPVILSPAATGPAPHGLGSTGDPRMNAPWTALGVPAISIPMPVAGLPLGLQLTAAPGHDSRLLDAAVRVAGLLQEP